MTHLNEFTLLRYAADDLDDIERMTAKRHIAVCPPCQTDLADMVRLDDALRELGPKLLESVPKEALPDSDPFARRPEVVPRPKASELGYTGSEFTSRCYAATQEADPVTDRALSAARQSETTLRELLGGLDLTELRDRYGLGYALDAVVRHHMTEGPPRWLAFVAVTLERLDLERTLQGEDPRSSLSPAEYAYPLVELRARCHLLAGYARNWTGDFAQGGEDLLLAYRLYAQGVAAEQSFALVEHHESQRRSFLDRPAEALVLAQRSRMTFEMLGLAEDAARAQFAEGLALSGLGREDEAVPAFRSTLPVFAEAGLWSAYASVLNNIGASLLFLGRLDEAHREYARALQKISATEQPSIHAFVRYNLALLLFKGGRHREAAASFVGAASLYERLGSTADALTATLYGIEALARGGEVVRASTLLAGFRRNVEAHEALESGTMDALERALSGLDKDFSQLTLLREQAESSLRQRLRA